MEPHPHRHHYRLLIGVFVAGIILMVLGLVSVVRRQTQVISSQPNTVTLDTPAPTPIPRAVFTVLETSRSSDSVTYEVVADAEGRSVLGFDTLLEISAESYTVESVESELFDTVYFQKPSHLTISGVKKLNVTESVTPQGASVAKIVLKSNDLPKTMPKVVAVVGRESSKMIFDDADSDTGLEKVSATVE